MANVTVHQLTPTDILLRKKNPEREENQGALVVRRIWTKPVIIPGHTHPHSQLTGFTLLDTVTLTDREVSAEELQLALDEGSLIPFYPETVRLVKGLTPRDFHKANGKIRQTPANGARTSALPD